MNNKINILFSSFPDYSGNPKALYQYIIKNYKNKFNIYWVFYSEDITKILEQHDIKINFVLYESKEYYDLINKINIIFDTNGFLVSEKKENQIYVNLWHGASPKKKGYLLNKENFAPQDEAYYKNMHLNTDYVVVPSEFSRLVFSSVFDINIQRVASLGYCRDDYLFNSNGKKLLKEYYGIDVEKYNKVLCYLPTFRVGCNRKDLYNFWEHNLLDLEKYDENELYEFLKDNNYLLLIKKHPSEESEINIPNSENIIVLEEEKLRNNLISIYEILNAVDLLISDYSSVYVEYLLLTRPVAFLHKNLTDYNKNRGIILDNIDFWSPGPQINNIETFKKEINQLITNTSYYLNERLHFITVMFDNNYENICKKTFEFFFNTDNFMLNCSPFYTDEKFLITNFKNLQQQYYTLENKQEILINDMNFLKSSNQSLENMNTQLKIQNDELNKTILNLKTELKIIYDSRSWKAVSSFQKLKKILKRRT